MRFTNYLQTLGLKLGYNQKQILQKEFNLENLLLKIDNLPKELQDIKEKILATQKSFIKISLKPAQDENYRASKVGGKPYLPIDHEYPLDQNGKPMEFLAQINFDEIEDVLEDYPKTGLLQFFIALDEWDWGLNFDNPLESYIKVIYHETTTKDIQTEFDFLDKPREDGESPIGKDEHRMVFSYAKEVLPWSDYRYANVEENIYKPYIEFDKLNKDRAEELENMYCDTFESTGHKIGGYAHFTQTDPRVYENKDYTELLLQIDSDDSADICWGDVGVANFFIRKEDLKNRDFSNILYNWDCY